jgi:hypothetical protein
MSGPGTILKKDLALAAGSVTFCLLMAEVGVRLFMDHPLRAHQTAINAAHVVRLGTMATSLHRPDPEIGWVLNPGAIRAPDRMVDPQGVVQYDVVYSVRDGHRITSADPHGGPALAAAGASFTFGRGLNDGDTWPWLLQERLPEYHVMNLAANGYGTDQALMSAERQIRKTPGQIRAVVLGFDDSQVEWNRSTQAWLLAIYPFSKPLFAVTTPERAEYRGQVKYWALGAPLVYSDLLMHLVNTTANRVYRIPSHQGARELTAALIITFARRFEALGTRLAVAVLPNGGDQSPLARGDRTFVIDRLKTAGIATLVPKFPTRANGELDVGELMLSAADKHPNRRYNNLLAEQIREFLDSAGLIDSPLNVRTAASAASKAVLGDSRPMPGRRHSTGSLQ